jgi:hypothetical protein
MCRVKCVELNFVQSRWPDAEGSEGKVSRHAGIDIYPSMFYGLSKKYRNKTFKSAVAELYYLQRTKQLSTAGKAVTLLGRKPRIFARLADLQHEANSSLFYGYERITVIGGSKAPWLNFVVCREQSSLRRLVEKLLYEEVSQIQILARRKPQTHAIK